MRPAISRHGSEGHGRGRPPRDSGMHVTTLAGKELGAGEKTSAQLVYLALIHQMNVLYSFS